MKSIYYILLVFFVININGVFSQNAPVSTINNEVSFEATKTISITGTGFNNIGSCNLQILYDPTIATCTSVNLGPGMAGGLATNIATPGVITIGWYTWPGLTLADNSVIFNLNFSRENFGSTAITWNADYGDRQWSNGSSEVLNDLPFSEYYIDGSLNFLSEDAIQLGIKVFLEGAYNSGEMSTTLNNNNLVPSSQPYSSAPWFYSGGESVSQIPSDAVDWILIELRETTGDATTATADKMVAKRAGFLMKDGSVKDMDGMTNLVFPVSPANNLFIVVYHRNHIAAISANPISIFDATGYYDFSSAETQVLGGSAGYKEITTGIWGLAAGDSNADGIINNIDKQYHWKLDAGMNGYLPSDYSMDIKVDNQDKNELWITNNNIKSSQVPE